METYKAVIVQEHDKIVAVTPAALEELHRLHKQLLKVRSKVKVGGKKWNVLDQSLSLVEAIKDDNLQNWAEFYLGFNAKNDVLPNPEFKKKLWPEVNKRFNAVCEKQLELFPELGPTA